MKVTLKPIFSWIIFGISMASLLVFNPSTQAQDLSALEIMQKNEAARKFDSMVTRTKLTTGAKTKEFSLWRKKQANGYNRTLTRFHSPAEVRNEGILILENESGRNEVLIYLPTFKKIRRVETQQQSGSFMGSAFSYSDIATPHVNDYTYAKLKKEPCPSAETAKLICEVIEATPANEDIRDRTGYSKSHLWVRPDNFMLVQAHYFGLDGTQIKILKSTKTSLLDAAKKKWHSHHIEMQNLKTQETTVLEFLKVDIKQEISDSTFTQQNLQKVN